MPQRTTGRERDKNHDDGGLDQGVQRPDQIPGLPAHQPAARPHPAGRDRHPGGDAEQQPDHAHGRRAEHESQHQGEAHADAERPLADPPHARRCPALARWGSSALSHSDPERASTVTDNISAPAASGLAAPTAPSAAIRSTR
jgi:hypothetical protein